MKHQCQWICSSTSTENVFQEHWIHGIDVSHLLDLIIRLNVSLSSLGTWNCMWKEMS